MLTTGSVLLDALIGLILAPAVLAGLAVLTYPFWRLSDHVAERHWRATLRHYRERHR